MNRKNQPRKFLVRLRVQVSNLTNECRTEFVREIYFPLYAVATPNLMTTVSHEVTEIVDVIPKRRGRSAGRRGKR